MIFTERNITIRNDSATINAPVILYRGDKNVEVRFILIESPYKYSNRDSINIFESTDASYAQLVIKTPNDREPIFGDITAVGNNNVTFVIRHDMIDEIEEVGKYDFQIRLFDADQTSMATTPEVVGGFIIKEPIAKEDSNNNITNSAIVGSAVVTNDVEIPTFVGGSYNKTAWHDGDVISKQKLNKMEDGIYETYELSKDNSSQIKEKANLNEVRLKTTYININDLDEETRKAILENNNIDINYVLGNDAVRKENIKNKEINADKISFIESYTQYLNHSLIIMDKRHVHGSISTLDSSGTCIYPPFRIYSGITYYYKDLYSYFSTIKYDNGNIIAVSEDAYNLDGSFTAEDDGYLYCCVNKVEYNQGKQPLICNNSIFPENIIYGDYKIIIYALCVKGENIEDRSINVSKTNFIREIKQYINISDLTYNSYYAHSTINRVNKDNVTSATLEPIRIYKGEEYFYNDIYGYFSTIKYDDGNISALSTTTDAYISGSFIAENDGYLYISVNTSNDLSTKNVCLSNSEKGLTSTKYGVIGNQLVNDINIQNVEDKSIKTNIISVKKDDTGDFTTIKGAVESINDSSQLNQYEIHIYSGIYNLVEEFGGVDWINSIQHSNGEKQGLILPDYVHLIGHGSVYIDCIVEDDVVTEDFAKSVSTINIWKNNNLEGITFRAKNTRYVIHDETGNGFSNLYRLIKNCRFIHLGTLSNLWYSPKAMGGGMGSGGRYDIINSHFESPFIPFSYHNNENQNTNYMNLDGCTFTGNKSTHQYDIGFGYYKKNTEKNYVTIKNCITDRPIAVYQETSVESDNVFEVIEINNIIRG